MARKSVDLPTGVELRNGAIRIRFTWNGQRQSETLTYPATQTGIASASRLRDQVVQLNKLGLLDDTKYTELFPGSSNAIKAEVNTFGVYTQSWLNSREIVATTRQNYKSILNNWWMPKLASTQIAAITPALLRTLIGQIKWTSPGVKLRAMIVLTTIMDSAKSDGLISKNPLEGLDVPKVPKKEVAPFSREEADQITTYLYEKGSNLTTIKGAFFEFAFYTGMRLCEISALRWSEIDYEKRTAFVCRIVSKGEVHERIKTGKTRYVLLNDKALHALEFAKGYITQRLANKGSVAEFPYCFPPSKNSAFYTATTHLHLGWREMLDELKFKYRPPYNARHTYATMCLMAGMNPAFIADQLGHSVQMLLSTYAKWLNNSGDWEQIAKLNIAPIESKT